MWLFQYLHTFTCLLLTNVLLFISPSECYILKNSIILRRIDYCRSTTLIQAQYDNSNGLLKTNSEYDQYHHNQKEELKTETDDIASIIPSKIIPVSQTPKKHGDKKNSKERPRIPVLRYEDKFACVNKPAGLTMHRSKGSLKHQFVLSTLLKRQFARKVWPVHRLDHRTSGAVLFAFDSETAAKLHSCLKQGEKSYLALVRGEWKYKTTDSDTPVVVNKPLNVKGEMKEAITEFRLLATSPGVLWGCKSRIDDVEDQQQKHRNNQNDHDDIEMQKLKSMFFPYDPSACSLLLCQPKTGRTHQIRRHAYSLGHPILGDTEHGDSKVNRWWRQQRSLDRLALHCLAMDLPPLLSNDDDDSNINSNEDSTNKDDMTNTLSRQSQDRIQVVAPLPPEFSNVLRTQIDNDGRFWNEAVKKEPNIDMEPIDLRGGTYGRHYKKNKERIDNKQRDK